MLIDHITTCMWTGIEMFGAVVLFGGFSMPRHRLKSFWIIFAIFVFSFSEILFWAADYLGWAKSVISVLMFVLFYWVEYEDNFLFQCQIAIIYYAILCTIDNLLFTGVLATSKYTLSLLKLVSSQYLLLGGIVHGTMLLVCFVLRFLRKHLRVRAAAWNWYVPPMIVSTLAVALIYYLRNCYSCKGIEEMPLFICAAFLTTVTIGAVSLVIWLERISRYREEALVLQAKVQAQTESLDAINVSYAEQRKYVHDFRAHLYTLSALMESSQLQDAQQYITKLQRISTERGTLVVTHNTTVDAILNQKALIAKKDAIDIRFVVNDLSALKLEATDLTVIISNLLDNAIEACRNLPTGERHIEVKALQEDSFFFSVRNRSLPVEIQNNIVATTKRDSRIHGYGLENVKSVLHKNHALFQLHYEDGWFLAYLDIPNKARL